MAASWALVCLWALVVTQARGDVEFLERREGESVLLPCALDRGDSPPLGVYLKRTWLRPGEVMFMYTRTELSATTEGDQKRIGASGDPSSRAVNVSISQLRVGDTDRYRCEFVVENAASADLHLPGTTDFFLLVTAGHCSCSGTPALLYALSAVVVFLFVLLCLTVVVFQAKSRRSVQVSRQPPIYEEMVGMLGTTGGQGPRAPGETEYKKSFPENHYETPRGRLRKTDQE
ncbi:uncharacterized protein LOC130526744 [Takifugu flavidus]|uniref:uncharacterized protein LOC130526744 n=1 Tax=Takifugu flavidus TaxID=433684 RepID=UPI0025444DC3|nr:uncharacterized protein LOC130526744 [Takifugu flavidus]